MRLELPRGFTSACPVACPVRFAIALFWTGVKLPAVGILPVAEEGLSCTLAMLAVVGPVCLLEPRSGCFEF